eukprot:3011170-Pleurochrysis_carterae.AAC.1
MKSSRSRSKAEDWTSGDQKKVKWRSKEKASLTEERAGERWYAQLSRKSLPKGDWGSRLFSEKATDEAGASGVRR